MQELFRQFAQRVSGMIGSVWTFLIFIALLFVTGFWFDFSVEWEGNLSFLIAVVTLSALFFLQKSQNHGDKATHLKLDELVRAIEGARNEVVSVEKKADEHIESLREE